MENTKKGTKSQKITKICIFVDTSLWKNRLSTVFLLWFGTYIPVEIPATYVARNSGYANSWPNKKNLKRIMVRDGMCGVFS